MFRPPHLSKRNRFGLRALIIIMLVVILTPYVMNRLVLDSERNSISIAKLNEKVERIEEKKREAAEERKKQKQIRKQKKYNTPPSKFDPNEYHIEDWIALGLSEKQATTIVNYLSKVTIYNNDKLKKIFVIDENLFDIIKDSTVYPIRLDKYYQQYDKKDSKKNKIIDIKVDINNATKEELLNIPGIGEYYATKIIEHRQKLGGYATLEQLLEIYRLDEEKLSQISKYLTIGHSSIKKIKVNICTVEDLKAHPYIRWKIAKIIIEKRTQYGKLEHIEQLLHPPIITQEVLIKISPYLSFSND